MLLYLRKLLKAEHAAEVVAQKDPFAALIEGRTHAFDLVLADQNMPGMTGIEFIRELRAITD